MDKTQKSKVYNMAISDFLNFAFLTPKNFKNNFKQNDHKIQNFQKI